MHKKVLNAAIVQIEVIAQSVRWDTGTEGPAYDGMQHATISVCRRADEETGSLPS